MRIFLIKYVHSFNLNTYFKTWKDFFARRNAFNSNIIKKLIIYYIQSREDDPTIEKLIPSDKSR